MSPYFGGFVRILLQRFFSCDMNGIPSTPFCNEWVQLSHTSRGDVQLDVHAAYPKAAIGQSGGCKGFPNEIELQYRA